MPILHNVGGVSMRMTIILIETLCQNESTTPPGWETTRTFGSAPFPFVPSGPYLRAALVSCETNIFSNLVSNVTNLN